MPDDTDVIVNALMERVFRLLDSSKRDQTASLILVVASLSLMIRRRLATLQEAIDEIESVAAVLDDPDGVIDEKVQEAVDLLRSVSPDPEMEGAIIESHAVKAKRRD